MNAGEEIPKVAIRPIDCLREGTDLIAQQYWLFVGMTALAVLIVGSVPLILQGPLYCGLYLCLMHRERGETVPFERMFKGFDVFVPSLIATVVYIAVVMAIVLPFVLVLLATFGGGAAAMDEHEEELGVALFAVGGGLALVFTALCVVATVLFTFAYPLIVDRGLSGLDAVKLSARACLRNFWGLTGLTLLTGLISVIAALACYVPVFFFLPISFASFWVAYRRIFPAVAETVETAPDARGGWGDPPPELPSPAL